MKIIRITNYLDFGGIEKHFEIIAKYQQKEEYTFIALGYGGVVEKKIKLLGYDVICLNENVKIPNFKLIWKLSKVIRSLSPDIVHSSAAEANFHTIFSAKIAKSPIIICEEIGIPNHSLIGRFVFRIAYRFANKIIGVSKSVSNYLVKSKEIPEKKSITIYNPAVIDSSDKETIQRDKETMYISTVCRLVPIKNLKSLIKEVKFLNDQHKPTQLFIVGDGPQKEELIDFSKIIKIKDFIHFVGFQENPYKYIVASDLFVLPSFSEGYAIAMVEAMMSGTPVISTINGGPKEILINGKNGWLFDPKIKNDLRNKILDFTELNKSERKIIANNGKIDVIKRFSPKIYIEDIHSLYNDLSLGK